jgi:hypothetical protein
MPWKPVFHGVENIHPDLPCHGKIMPDFPQHGKLFSTPWKIRNKPSANTPAPCPLSIPAFRVSCFPASPSFVLSRF